MEERVLSGIQECMISNTFLKREGGEGRGLASNRQNSNMFKRKKNKSRSSIKRQQFNYQRVMNGKRRELVPLGGIVN